MTLDRHQHGRPGIPARMLIAYRKTSYKAAGIEVRIGRRSPAMDRLLSSHGVREAVFITAYNPFSRVMPPGWNQRMQLRLAQVLRRRQCLPAQGSWRRWSEAHLHGIRRRQAGTPPSQALSAKRDCDRFDPGNRLVFW